MIVALAALALLGAVLLTTVAEAYAYDPSNSARSCADCHGRVADEATETVAPTRKGPHGAYGATTSKCATCHSVHAAAADGYALLPGATAKAVCESCHDGTGGHGVYGAVAARGGTVQSAHRVEVTSEIPGGDPAGGARAGFFSGPGATLTCTDCHSPHDSNTVEPFVGDRLRSADDTGAAVPTNRLLRALPDADGTRIDRYGSEWCVSCHQGYHLVENGIDPVTGTANRHPVGFMAQVDGEARFHYDSVRVVAGTESTETAWGPLGGSNRGYVMPHLPGDMRGYYGLQKGRGPLCQQCHEDARDVGGVLDGSPVLLATQEFVVSAYGPEGDASEDNPRFQVFPHESDQPGFRVTRSDPDASAADGFCLRCHVPGS
ncbi:MAG: cytochrome c3 family protein [Coriobacteriia bacterium]|nr:cytochrome c3 family protein [Coriobacteriia bacterium]